MLEGYLDDSGTHDASRVMVWGAMTGDKLRFNDLSVAWKAKLLDPCEGRKPPIKAFHSSHLLMGVGEFEGYSQAERDITRRVFRDIITEQKLTFFAIGIAVDAWNKVAAEHEMLAKMFTPESFTFAGTFKIICQEARVYGEPITFFIDQERFTPEFEINIKIAMEKAGVTDQFVSYTGAPVKGVTGLQAADLVAHEIYQFYLSRLDDSHADPSAHLQSLLKGVFSFRDGWFGEEELRSMVKKAGGRIDWSLKDVASD